MFAETLWHTYGLPVVIGVVTLAVGYLLRLGTKQMLLGVIRDEVTPRFDRGELRFTVLEEGQKLIHAQIDTMNGKPLGPKLTDVAEQLTVLAGNVGALDTKIEEHSAHDDQNFEVVTRAIEDARAELASAVATNAEIDRAEHQEQQNP